MTTALIWRLKLCSDDGHLSGLVGVIISFYMIRDHRILFKEPDASTTVTLNNTAFILLLIFMWAEQLESSLLDLVNSLITVYCDMVGFDLAVCFWNL